MKDDRAAPGKPAQHGRTRVRWRHVIRETRKVNRAAVEKIAEAEIAMKRRHTRAETIAVVLRNLLIGAAFAAAIYWRCAP